MGFSPTRPLRQVLGGNSLPFPMETPLACRRQGLILVVSKDSDVVAVGKAHNGIDAVEARLGESQAADPISRWFWCSGGGATPFPTFPSILSN